MAYNSNGFRISFSRVVPVLPCSRQPPVRATGRKYYPGNRIERRTDRYGVFQYSDPILFVRLHGRVV